MDFKSWRAHEKYKDKVLEVAGKSKYRDRHNSWTDYDITRPLGQRENDKPLLVLKTVVDTYDKAQELVKDQRQTRWKHVQQVSC